MTGDKKNALAVLAKRLRFHAEVAESGHALDDHASIDLDDAYHIIAELAKVEEGKDYVTKMPLSEATVLLRHNLAEMYYKCRAIAEEGAEDEQA